MEQSPRPKSHPRTFEAPPRTFEPHPRAAGVTSPSLEVQTANGGVFGLDHGSVQPVTPADSTASTGTATQLEDAPCWDKSAASLAHVVSAPSDATETRVPDITTLINRVFELERRIDGTGQQQGNAGSASHATRSSAPAGDPRAPVQTVERVNNYLAPELHRMSKSVMSKGRYYGHSHWMNVVSHFKPLMRSMEAQPAPAKAEAVAVLNRCKKLAQTIKACRWPEDHSTIGAHIPSREVADALVDGYLRTTETVWRILHVPSFRSDYERFWAAPDSVPQAFVVQLQLVMAIGCALHDDRFSLRKTAVRWLQEAQAWLAGPVPKARLTIAGLQVMLLQHVAQQTTSVGGDLVWISVGSLMRTAIYMGLHRDPGKLPRMSYLDAELRRRLWNTILEFEVEASVDSGGPPMISLENSDTNAPANVDDEQLLPEVREGGGDADADVDASTAPLPPADDDNAFTDTSIALAFRESFRVRLAIARLLNDITSKGTYEDTIRLHSQLSTAHRSLTHKLRSLGRGVVIARGGGAGAGSRTQRRRPSDFQRRFVDLLVRRYFLALHMPYRGTTVQEQAAYAFSRTLVLDTAIKLYCTGFPAALRPDCGLTRGGDPSEDNGPDDPGPDDLSDPNNEDDDDYDMDIDAAHEDEVLSTAGDDLARMLVCCCGLFRSVISQTVMLFTLELQTAINEHQQQHHDDGEVDLDPMLQALPLSGNDEAPPPPALLRPDVVRLQRHSRAYSLARLRAGETNVKGYMFGQALAADIAAVVGRGPGSSSSRRRRRRRRKVSSTKGMGKEREGKGKEKGEEGEQEEEREEENVPSILRAARATERQAFLGIFKRQAERDAAERAAAAGDGQQFDWESMVPMDRDWGADSTSMTNFFDLFTIESLLGGNSGGSGGGGGFPDNSGPGFMGGPDVNIAALPPWN
ncbi:hypothetical protein GGR56DRAFT_684465 [Xylariaceae sp. FL0804]|nr:hypothetical protein GGR56DRAFT_684465 [Xylariaceae sp. FL0804]